MDNFDIRYEIVTTADKKWSIYSRKKHERKIEYWMTKSLLCLQPNHWTFFKNRRQAIKSLTIEIVFDSFLSIEINK